MQDNPTLAEQTIPLLDKLAYLSQTIDTLSASGHMDSVATYENKHTETLSALIEHMFICSSPIIREVEQAYDLVVSTECKITHDQSPAIEKRHLLFVSFRGIVERRTCAPPTQVHVMFFAQELARVINEALAQEGVPLYLYVSFDGSLWSEEV